MEFTTAESISYLCQRLLSEDVCLSVTFTAESRSSHYRRHFTLHFNSRFHIAVYPGTSQLAHIMTRNTHAA